MLAAKTHHRPRSTTSTERQLHRIGLVYASGGWAQVRGGGPTPPLSVCASHNSLGQSAGFGGWSATAARAWVRQLRRVWGHCHLPHYHLGCSTDDFMQLHIHLGPSVSNSDNAPSPVLVHSPKKGPYNGSGARPSRFPRQGFPGGIPFLLTPIWLECHPHK